ncbi:hypothetical protein ES708_31077 [subsurface metagenome]
MVLSPTSNPLVLVKGDRIVLGLPGFVYFLKDFKKAKIFYSGEYFKDAFSNDILFLNFFNLLRSSVKVFDYKISTIVFCFIYYHSTAHILKQLSESALTFPYNLFCLFGFGYILEHPFFPLFP